MRQREFRQPVSVRARLRVDSGWQDAVILNLSSKGLMFRCAAPVQRSHFLELCRGAHVLVAQVMRSEDGKCGAKAQGVIPIADFVLDRPSKRSKLLPGGLRRDLRGLLHRQPGVRPAPRTLAEVESALSAR